MRRTVIVEEQADFDKWFKEQQPLYQGQVMPPPAPRKIPSSGHAAPAHGHEGDHSHEGTKESESKEQHQEGHQEQPQQEGATGSGH